MRNGGSQDAAEKHTENQKRHPTSRLPPIAIAPTPQTMLQDDIMNLPALSLNPNSGRRAAEEWGVAPLGSSRALSSGVARRRVPAGTGLEPLSLKPRQPSSGVAASTGSLPLPSAKLPRQPLFQASPLPTHSNLGSESRRSSSHSSLPLERGPVARRDSQGTRDIVSATSPRRPPKSNEHFASRPHGLPLRREARNAATDVVEPAAQQRRPDVERTAPSTSTQSAPSESQGSASREEGKAFSDGPKGDVSDPKYAAKCAAVASLQRLFFEEVGRSGDANAAAAAALLRLAEESRPASDLTPRHMRS